MASFLFILLVVTLLPAPDRYRDAFRLARVPLMMTTTTRYTCVPSVRRTDGRMDRPKQKDDFGTHTQLCRLWGEGGGSQGSKKRVKESKIKKAREEV